MTGAPGGHEPPLDKFNAIAHDGVKYPLFAVISRDVALGQVSMSGGMKRFDELTSMRL